MGMEPKDDERGQPAGITRPMASMLAVAAGLTRLIPHPWNLSPAYATEFFAGARLRSWHAFAIPLAVRVLTDILLLPYHLPFVTKPILYLAFMPFVYASVTINILLGRLVARTESPLRIGSLAIVASVQFFLITNFGVWLGSDVYPATLAGLAACYAAGLAYYGPTLASYVVFSGVLFGAHAWLTRTSFPAERVPALAK